MDPIKEDNELYIKNQKTQIDKMLGDFNYRPAFHLLVLTLSKLNEKEAKDFIQYYNNFKAINDKWVAGNNYNSETLLEDILFLDRAGRDIGDKIYINVLDFIT